MTMQPQSQQAGTSYDRASPRTKTTRNQSDIAEVERKRIGREFHDGLGQKLTSVSVAASILVEKLHERDIPEVEDARRLLRMIRETVRDARNLARGLNPAALLNRGLENAIEELLAQVDETTPFETSLQISEWQSVDDEQRALHVFRIIQEAVNNAVKHSEGEKITVTLSSQQGMASVEVHDDGKGLPTDLRGFGGMGLALMNQRASAIGATLMAEQRDGGGTVVRCSFSIDG